MELGNCDDDAPWIGFAAVLKWLRDGKLVAKVDARFAYLLVVLFVLRVLSLFLP